MAESPFQERRRIAVRNWWRRQNWPGYAETHPIQPGGRPPPSAVILAARAAAKRLVRERRALLIKEWRPCQILHCKTCRLPFMRSELPRSNNRCRPCKKALAHHRRALKLGNGGSCSPTQWKAVLARYDNKCQRCGSGENLTRDHIIPVSLGGSDDHTNLQPLCHLCNSTKCNVMTGAVQACIPGVRLTYV